jgi:hypothetical protein
MTKTQLTLEWIDLSKSNSIRVYGVSDREIAKKTRLAHIRSGKIDSRAPIKSARGVAVLAVGRDELGNIVALCADGFNRQFS